MTDRTEKIARIIDPKAFAPVHFTGDPDWRPDDKTNAQNIALRKAATILASVPDQGEAVAWRDGAEIPPVGVGTECEYIVAVYRKRTDKTYTFAASYLNAFRVENDDAPCDSCDDKCADEGTCPLTGWYLLTGDGNYDAGCYWSLTLYEGDELRGWCELPTWDAAPHVQTPQVSEDYVLVPREPTDKMIDAATAECHRMAGCLDPVMHIWDVMIAASQGDSGTKGSEG